MDPAGSKQQTGGQRNTFQDILHMNDSIIGRLKTKRNNALQSKPVVHGADGQKENLLLQIAELEADNKTKDSEIDFIRESLDSLLQQNSEFMKLLQAKCSEISDREDEQSSTCSLPEQTTEQMNMDGSSSQQLAIPSAAASSSHGEKSSTSQTIGATSNNNPDETDEDIETEDSDVEDQLSVKYMPEDNYWENLADKAKPKAKRVIDSEKKELVYSVLCIDSSASMTGKPWEKMLQFVNDFLDHISNDIKDGKYDERVALVTFGKGVRVRQHFTSDFDRIRHRIGKVYPRGPSPLQGGLLTSFKIAHEAPSFPVAPGLVNCPRILLVTDGIATQSDIIDGPEISDGSGILDGQTAATYVGHRCAEFGVNLFVLPVGDYYEGFIQSFARESCATVMYTQHDCKMMFKRTVNSIPACQIVSRQNNEPVFMKRTKDTTEIATEYPNLSEEDLDYVLGMINGTISGMEESRDKRNKNEDKSLLFGSRVRRGKDWQSDCSEDENLPGTVVGFRPDHYVRVRWDNDIAGIYLYDARKGFLEVREVDEKRVMDYDGDVQAGYYLKRGPDWCHKNDKEHDSPDSIGTVLSVEPQRLVRLAWANGNTGRYRFGYCGQFDLCICEPDETPKKKKNKNALLVNRSKIQSIKRCENSEVPNFEEDGAGNTDGDIEGFCDTTDGNEEEEQTISVDAKGNIW